MPAPDLSEMADTAFRDLGATLPNAGVETTKAWNTILGHRQNLELTADQTASSLTELAELPAYVPAEERDYKRKLALDIFDSVDQASTAGMQAGFAELRATLEKAAVSDLQPSTDSTARLLLRADIDAYMAANGGGVAGLLRAAADPRFTAEIATSYGYSVLAREGMSDRAPEIVRGILASVPATTPKAQAARIALKKLDAAQGHVTGLAHGARQKVAATQPRPRSNVSDFIR